MLLSLALSFSLLTLISTLETKDGSGRLPILGWNSWNAYRCDIDESKILSAAQELKQLGLQSAGYTYINIDDCWSIKSRRDPNTGRIIADPSKFPNGISGLADTLHSLGFKIGIYSDAGTTTCAGYPGSLYHEDVDAEAFAEWGVDYLKYDNCDVPDSWPRDQYHNCHPDYNHPNGPNNTCINDPRAAPAGYDWSTSSTAQRFRRMRDALGTQNRTIVYSMCEWGQAGVEQWGNDTAQSWRVTDDIFPYWEKIAHIAAYNSRLLNHVGFYSHNDADMLEIGNGNLTYPEARSHFALWAAMKSPLLIGTDLGVLEDRLVRILGNRYLLDFNQDTVVGEPAKPFKWDYTKRAEYWTGRYGDGRRLVLMVNYKDGKETKRVMWGEMEGTRRGRRYQVTDVWTGESGCVNGMLERVVDAHDTAAFVVGGVC
ncbi:glycoside hydrolase [Wilcoxina mikolae CBS 423.85]|nr:glycoside hydrolase [Wilcoxina mikolae CBS 423.85]